jgi:hypothetical protein
VSVTASAGPGKVDSELASATVTTNRIPHLGQRKRLPAVARSGMFKITPHCLH